MDEVAENDDDLDGVATTYTGTDSNEEQTYGLSGNLFDKLYNADSYTLEWINLGLIPIYDPDYKITEDLLYVKIVVNGYEYMYEYNDVNNDDLAVEDTNNISFPIVSYQHSEKISSYTRYVYPSDLALALLDEDEVKVYVVYSIEVENRSDYNYLETRYVEEELHITQLVNTYDSSRYYLDTSSNTSDENSDFETEKSVNDCFGLWSEYEDEDGNAKAKLDIEGYNEVIGETENTDSINVGPYEDTETSTEDKGTAYIQFRVTQSAIADILDNPSGIAEDYPTEATSNAYHTYTRKDYSWDNKITKTQTHKTTSKEKSDDAPYLVFKLPDEDEDNPEEVNTTYLNREISGVVFEDTDISSEDDEALGDGQYDSDSESVVANVTVNLLSSGNAVYKYAVYNEEDGKYYLYDGEKYWEYDSEGNISIVTDIDLTSADALITATSDSSGSYTLSGMVPGEYTLKFTYYDENYSDENLRTTINGETISINDYKSTIVTSSSAKDAIKGNDSTNGEWYKDYDGNSETSMDDEEKNYSVAVDDLQQREDYNKEYYEALYDDEKTVTTTIMEASTATFDITVEDTTDTSHLGYTTIYYEDSEGNSITEEEAQNLTNYTMYTDSFFAYEYTGFNFGIIIQPIQSLDIDKVITNVKLVNDPTILFDGNPETDDLEGVSDLDGVDNDASTYTRIEVEENEMYGATFTVTYEITITNTSQINYYETEEAYYGWYYMFGETVDCSEIVYIDIETLLDYLDYDLTLLDSMYETATSVDENTTKELDSTNVEKTSITTERQNDEIDVNKYTITELTPVAREEEGSSDVVKLTATKVLSTSEDDMAYSNVAEIIQARNSDKDGSEDDDIPTSIKLVKAPILPEESEAYVTISPPTGGDVTTVLIYVIAGLGMLIILSVGIVIIKKKIL